MFMRLWAVLVFSILLNGSLRAQCPSADFSLQPSACRNERIEITNLSSGATSFNWDFCTGDLLSLPTGLALIPTINSLGTLTGVEAVEDNGNYYLFLTGRTSDNLVRVNFGNDIRNTSPVISNLGSFSGELNGPVGIKFMKENGNWYSIVYNSGNDKLIRLSFGNSLANIPSSAQQVITGYGGANNGMDLVRDGSNIICVVTQPSSGNITLIDFGNSITNTPQDPADVITSSALPGANLMRGLTIMKDCDTWYGYAVNSGDNKILRLNFGTSLFALPTVTDITGTPVGADNFVDIKIFYDAGKYVGFIMTAQGVVYSLDFSASLTNTPVVTSLGNLLVFNNTLYFDFIKANSTWSFFAGSFSTSTVYRGDFPDVCSAAVTSVDDVIEPIVTYSSNGTYTMSLTATDASGNISYQSKNIAVTSQNAPDITFDSQNNCINNDVFFTSQNTSGDILSYLWDFDDLSTSGDQDPVHQFSNAAQFDVHLEVTAANGCKNRFSQPIKVYNPPDPSFVFPPGLLCTNNDLSFVNSTPDIFDGNLTYQWYVDGQLTSTDLDLNIRFIDTAIKTIKLKTSIPGCSDEVTQSTPELKAGPIVDFSFIGKCEDDAVQFTSDIDQSVISYDWQFSDGASSAMDDPAHIFADNGNYAVTLSVLSTNGCNNSKIKIVSIYTKPLVDFKIDPPPLSCSGSATGFTDLTVDPIDSDLQSWQWNFGDAGAGNTSVLRNPSHTYANAGMYTVSLTTTTDAGCSALWEEQITVSQSPAVTIGNSPTCVGVPVNFSATGSDIKSYYWEMGTLYYEVANPVHTFNAAGNQSVKLTIQGNNNCITVYNRPITVPVVLSPDFSVIDNCTGHEAVFTDITTGADPVVQRTWDFAGLGTSSGQPASFGFTSTGNKNIKLTVTTQAGCLYTKNKMISVVAPPVAAFTASPESGGTPLFVQFTNTSVGATNYTWSIDEGSIFTTNQVSPSYTFTQAGSFLVTLAASAPQGCASLIVKEINTTAGLPDVDLKLITTTENADGTMKVIITVQNKGNTILRNLPVVIDISGRVSLTETIAGPVGIASMYNLVLSYGLIPDDNLKFLCAKATLENDQTPEGNRICKEFNDGVFLFNAYPNPAKGELTIEWIAPKDEAITISLVDSSGKKIVLSEVSSLEGLNSSRLSLNNIKNGLYILRIQGASLLKTQRIFVSGQN